ncbi:MAG: hypothetical protein BroJett029_00190 [Alphaproteobacteria bacterium]|nr:MAG: hypothetical protein BroJett029_00190 [Alphaproteobacteria bacterium]
MNAEVVGGIVRHILTGVGGYFVATGMIDPGTVDVAVGAVVALVGVAWSVWAKAREAR